MGTYSLLADQLDPPKRDVFGLLGYVPTPRQQAFHDADAFDKFYGGAAGGGKTKALLMEGIRAADHHPRLRVGAFRRTYDELAESFIKELELIDFAEALGCTWNATRHELRFPNRSIIRFRYLESVVDATRRQGGEYQLVLFDEVTLIDPNVVAIVAIERVRSGPGVPVLGVRAASNPGGIGHAHAKARYIDLTGHGEHTYVDDRGRTVAFVPAKIKDNPHLNPEYVRDMESIPDPSRRAAMLEGSWTTFAGQFFPEWRHDRHVVDPFPIPEEWSRIQSLDWGYRDPYAVLWGAYHDGRLWVYRESFDNETTERDLARRILDAEGGRSGDLLAIAPRERIHLRVADPSTWAKHGEAQPVAITLAAEGVPHIQAANDRISGWQRIHTWLADAPACPIHREIWERGEWGDPSRPPRCPGVHVFSTCPHLIEAIPAMVHHDKKPEDVADHPLDHAPDSFRYMVMHLPVPITGREREREPSTPEERAAAYLARRRTSDSDLPVGA